LPKELHQAAAPTGRLRELQNSCKSSCAHTNGAKHLRGAAKSILAAAKTPAFFISQGAAL